MINLSESNQRGRMITIEPCLAQEIVERTMKIIPFNVNVMDGRGIILGSGNPARVGQLHSGAQLAIAQQRTVEIAPENVRNLPGVKPSVNLPLTVRGQICGVVGLTGKPETVRQFGELVRVNAEMILEQAQLTSELQREKRYREEFVFQLVNQNGTSLADMEAWGVRLGVDLSLPRSVLICQLTDENQRPDLALMELQRCQASLTAQSSDILVAAVSPRELVVLVAIETVSARCSVVESARQRMAALDAMLKKSLESPMAMAIGVALAGADGVPLSYQSARKTLRVGRLRRPQERFFSYYELSLPVLLSALGSGWQAEQLRKPLQSLLALDRHNGILRKTLEVWFAENGHPLATAKALHIHRNTLDYRLRKIAEITGLVLNSAESRMLLYIALQLE